MLKQTKMGLNGPLEAIINYELNRPNGIEIDFKMNWYDFRNDQMGLNEPDNEDLKIS